MCANVVVLAGASGSCTCRSFLWCLGQAFVLVFALWVAHVSCKAFALLHVGPKRS
jgi:hypothetical protein